MKELVVRAKGDDAVEVMLYDVIGADFFTEGVTAKALREQIRAVKAPLLNLRVNSPGGSVTEGAAMLSALDDWRAKKKGRVIEVDVDGVAASAASFVMMAGTVIRVAGNALVMIHDPHAMVQGGAGEMRRTAELLDKVREQILDAYERHSKAGREQIGAWMAAETWFTGQEAVDAGLAHSVTGPVSVAAFAGQRELLARLGARKVPELPQADEKAWELTRRCAEMAARL